MADEFKGSQLEETANGIKLLGASATDDDVATYAKRWEQSKKKNIDQIERAKKVDPGLAEMMQKASDVANEYQEPTYRHSIDYLKRRAIQKAIK